MLHVAILLRATFVGQTDDAVLINSRCATKEHIVIPHLHRVILLQLLNHVRFFRRTVSSPFEAVFDRSLE